MRFDSDSEVRSSTIFSGGASIWLAAFAAVALFLMGGCARMMNSLRSEPDSNYSYEREPTMGGRFMEGGFLDSNLGRAPSSLSDGQDPRSMGEGRMGGESSWLSNHPDERSGLRRPSYADGSSDRNVLPERPVMQERYKNGARASRADFIDDSSSDGSLWSSDGQTNYFLTKNQVKTQGDLVTIVADDEFVRDVAAELKRTMTPDEREAQMDLAQERARRVAMGLPETEDAAATGGDAVATAQSAPERAPASESGKKVTVPQVKWSQVDLRKSMEMKSGDQVMTEVLERYPNGNYKLRGLKRVRVDGQVRMVSVIAIARNTDIGTDETVPAGKLYEYRIESVR